MIMNARNREYYRKKLMRETEEERTRRIENQRANYQKMRMRETEEERTRKNEKRKANYQTKKKEIRESYRKKLREETEEERRVRLENQRERYRKLIERQTPEEYQQRMKLRSERRKQLIMNETPEQKQRRLERRKRPEQLEARRQRAKDRWKNMTEEQRQKRREQRQTKREQARLTAIKRRNETELRAQRLAVNEKSRQRKMIQMTEAEQDGKLERRHNTRTLKSKSSGECTATDIPQTDVMQENAEANETATKRQGRSAKCKESVCSMTLAEKWGLRPLIVRLERIDVAEFVQKIKQESAAIQVKRTRKRN